MVVVNVVTPFNDYALNSFFVGNNLPLGLMGMALLFVVCVNGPLSRWAPRQAFSSAELTVAFSLALVGCALPSSGLMRYLPNACPEYFPGNFPSIPMGYNLGSLFSEQPLSDVSYAVKANKVWWAAVGMTYFLSTPVAFSLWVFIGHLVRIADRRRRQFGLDLQSVALGLKVPTQLSIHVDLQDRGH